MIINWELLNHGKENHNTTYRAVQKLCQPAENIQDNPMAKKHN